MKNDVENFGKIEFYISLEIVCFMQSEALEIPGTCSSLFEIAADTRFPTDMRRKVHEIITMFGNRVGIDDLRHTLTVNYFLKQSIFCFP